MPGDRYQAYTHGDEVGEKVLEAPRRLLFAADVAKQIGMTEDWVYAQVRAGKIPHVRMGRSVRFRQQSIDTWIEESERVAA